MIRFSSKASKLTDAAGAIEVHGYERMVFPVRMASGDMFASEKSLEEKFCALQHVLTEGKFLLSYTLGAFF